MCNCIVEYNLKCQPSRGGIELRHWPLNAGYDRILEAAGQGIRGYLSPCGLGQTYLVVNSNRF